MKMKKISISMSSGRSPFISVGRPISGKGRTNASLGRPRIKIPSPVVFFTATAALRPAQRISPHVVDDEYMPSLVPAGLNLLEPLKDDPTLGGVQPRLSALRVSRVAPATPVSRELLRSIRTVPTQKYRVFPAISSRVRYTHLGAHPVRASVMASLDVEVPSLAHCDVIVDGIKIDLEDGIVESLGGEGIVRFPRDCLPKDEFTLLYKLWLTDDMISGVRPGRQVRHLDVSLSARAKISEGCVPSILVRWRTQIDFSRPSSTSLVTRLQHVDAASSQTPPLTGGLSPAASSADHPRVQQTPGTPAPLTGTTEENHDVVSSSDFGISVTFRGPKSVSVGETFHWGVFLVNHSVKPRKFALSVIPRRRRGDIRKHISKPSNSSAAVAQSEGLAEAVMDENIVYAVQKNAVMEPAEIVCLSTDVRIGYVVPRSILTA